MLYEFTKDMGEISGFGGEYEDACRKMLNAGLIWLDENPEANPIVKANPQIYGIVKEENKDAEALSKVIGDAVEDCSGAMHHAVISHCLWIKNHSWVAFCQEMRNRKGKTN